RLPAPGPLQELGDALSRAMADGKAAPVRAAADALLVHLAEHFGVSAPSVRVLGVRPHRVEDGVCTYQLFGDYTPSTERIRVWMRTAIRGNVSSPKAVRASPPRATGRHLDCTALASPRTFPRRGSYVRAAGPYPPA